MPYKNKSDVADCTIPCLPADMIPKLGPCSNFFLHGELLKCCCFRCDLPCCVPCLPCCNMLVTIPWCAIQCNYCTIDCGQCAALCKGCSASCKPACDCLLKCETMCQQDCAFGPEIAFKAMGCELTCGIAALEGIMGVWHVASDMCPYFCPAVICQHESKSGETFSPSASPVETAKCSLGKCILTPCLQGPACKPHTFAQTGPCGFFMDPLFGGNLPFWFCKETKPPSLDVKMTTCGQLCAFGTAKVGST